MFELEKCMDISEDTLLRMNRLDSSNSKINLLLESINISNFDQEEDLRGGVCLDYCLGLIDFCTKQGFKWKNMLLVLRFSVRLLIDTAAKGLNLQDAVSTMKHRLPALAACLTFMETKKLIDFLLSTVFQHYSLYLLCMTEEQHLDLTTSEYVIETPMRFDPLSCGTDINTWNYQQKIKKVESENLQMRTERADKLQTTLRDIERKTIEHTENLSEACTVAAEAPENAPPQLKDVLHGLTGLQVQYLEAEIQSSAEESRCAVEFALKKGQVGKQPDGTAANGKLLRPTSKNNRPRSNKKKTKAYINLSSKKANMDFFTSASTCRKQIIQLLAPMILFCMLHTGGCNIPRVMTAEEIRAAVSKAYHNDIKRFQLYDENESVGKLSVRLSRSRNKERDSDILWPKSRAVSMRFLRKFANRPFRNNDDRAKVFMRRMAAMLDTESTRTGGAKHWSGHTTVESYPHRTPVVDLTTPSMTRKVRLINRVDQTVNVKGFVVSGSDQFITPGTSLQMESVGYGAVMIKSLSAKKYICMDKKTGNVTARAVKSLECVFIERMLYNHYTTYQSFEHRNDKRHWYLAINSNGKVVNGKKSEMYRKTSQFNRI
eukprot:gene4748-5372_t